MFGFRESQGVFARRSVEARRFRSFVEGPFSGCDLDRNGFQVVITPSSTLPSMTLPATTRI
jgi:hypothetical protein